MEDSENKFNKINKKLDEHPELRDEIAEHINRLSEIFDGAEVDLGLSFYPMYEDYNNKLDEYNHEEILGDENKKQITLDEFREILNKEDGKFNVSFDPIYLKKGVNQIVDFILTTYEDKVIIVPIIDNKDE